MEATITAAVTRQTLIELGIPINRVGFQYLCIAIPAYAKDSMQSLTKELYPAIGIQFGYPNGYAVERAIRNVIVEAWEHGSADTWAQCFPWCSKAPSNSLFIATLAERLK